MTHRSRAVLALVVMAVLTAACARQEGTVAADNRLSGTTITFSIAVPDEEKPAIQELVTRFQAQTRARVNLELLTRFRNQPENRVQLRTDVTSTGLIATIKADLRSGRPTIHLFAQDNLALKPLVDDRLVQDLSSVAVPREVRAGLMPARFEGRQFFLPFRPNVRLAYANRERFERWGLRAPTTVEEFAEVARRLKAAEGRPGVTLSLAEGDPAAVTVSEWILAFGGDPLVLNDEGSVAAFGTLQQLWREGLLARESLFARYDTEVDNLARGTALLAQNWSFTSAQLAEKGLLRRFEVSPGWRGPTRAAHVIGGDVLGVPRGVRGRQREAALALAEFLMSREAQELLVKANAWPPIRDDAYGKVSPEQEPTFAAIRTALSDGWYRPSVSYWPEVTTQMNRAVDRILLQQQPVRPVLDELHAAIEAAAHAKGEPYPPSG